MKREYEKWSEMLNSNVKMWQLPEYAKPKGMRVTGIISDLHVPFHNARALEFLVDTFLKRGVTHIICIGDFLDNYWNSKKYLKNYNLMSGPKETMIAAQNVIDLFAVEFPYMKYVLGNHEQRIVASNTDDYFEDIEKVLRRSYKIPSTWIFENQFIIDDVCYLHGTGVTGQNAAMTMMRTKRMSTVIGHTHIFSGVQFSNNDIETSFAMNVGCLIDPTSIVFDYGVNNREKPVLGCGVVYNRSYAEFVPLVQ